MNHAKRQSRKFAPPANIVTEVPVEPTPVKASFWTRVTDKVKSVASTVAKPFKAVARKVASVFKKTVRTVSPYAKAIATRAARIARRAWSVAIRPFLWSMVSAVAICSAIGGLIFAPLITSLLISGAVIGFVMTARLISYLEDIQAMSKVARIALTVCGIFGKLVKAALLAGAALLTVAWSLVSVPFATYTLLSLSLNYWDIRNSNAIAFTAWCFLSGSWVLGLTYLAWKTLRSIRRPLVEEVSVDSSDADADMDEAFMKALLMSMDTSSTETIPHTITIEREEVAHIDTSLELSDVSDAESETWADAWAGPTPCAACGSDDDGIRIKSSALPVITCGSKKGQPDDAPSSVLCSSCYDAECEDTAIAMTGVSLKKCSVRFSLTRLGRSLLPVVQQSKEDLDNYYWTTVAWWRDRRGDNHDTQWDCYSNGEAIASVRYEHKQKLYHAYVMGKVVEGGTMRTMEGSKVAAMDALFELNPIVLDDEPVMPVATVTNLFSLEIV